MDKNSIIFLVIFFVIEIILLTLNFTHKPKYEDDLTYNILKLLVMIFPNFMIIVYVIIFHAL
jgi:hypothetical protein